ncbi:hypothetical protein Tco_0107313, partial [Tanacetum coccineum]
DPYAYVVAAFQAPSSPDYVYGPEEDEVFLTEEQPLPAVVSPIADSPRYIADSYPEEDEEDLEEDPIDYLVDGGDDDDDDDDDESSDDDEDDDDDVDEDEDEEEEEEHPALADSVLPLIARLLSIPSPPPSPLSPWSSPLPQIPSPPLLVSPPLSVSPPLPVSPPPLPASPIYPLVFRAAMIWQRSESPSTSHSLPLPPPIILSYTRASVAMMRAASPSTYTLAPPSGTLPLLHIPLPTPSPPLLLPSTDCRADMPDVCLPPRKRLRIA